MSHCLNPFCQRPQNPDGAKFCSNCGFKLLLGDRYRALQAIARGGFGRTFLAVDEYKPSRPQCVIKQFFPKNQNPSDPERARELFRREAVQLENLGQHPQIPELLAHFEQTGYQYLIQEFIDGNNLLQELSRQGVFTEVQVWQLLSDLLPVLDFIHTRGIIHRDIKPQNIIRRYSNQEYVLVDFGAAKAIAGSELLLTGTSIGSPAFTAPEQALGKATYASDLYSLGVTCIYLLTQVRPADLFDTEEGVWVWQHHLTTPVNSILGGVLDKLLQGPIKYRYQSAKAVLADLNTPDILTALAAMDSNSVAIATPVRSKAMDALPSDDTQVTILPPTALPATGSTTIRWTCTRTLTGHTSWVRSVVIHPDGRSLVTGSGDKTIKIWNLETGELLRTIAAHASWVRGIALSPDRQTLASCSNDRTIKLWHWETGELLQTITGHSDWVRAVAFSPDGRILASSSQDKTVRLWQVATGELLQVLSGHHHWVTALTFSPDGQTLISASRDKTIRVWRLPANAADKVQRVTVLEGHTDAVNAIAVTHTHTDASQNASPILVSGGDDATIRLWNLNTGAPLQTLTEHEGAVNALAISASNNSIISASHDRTARIWRMSPPKLLHTAKHPNWVWSVAMSADEQTVVSGGWDSTIKVWQRQ